MNNEGALLLPARVVGMSANYPTHDWPKSITMAKLCQGLSGPFCNIPDLFGGGFGDQDPS